MSTKKVMGLSKSDQSLLWNTIVDSVKVTTDNIYRGSSKNGFDPEENIRLLELHSRYSEVTSKLLSGTALTTEASLQDGSTISEKGSAISGDRSNRAIAIRVYHSIDKPFLQELVPPKDSNGGDLTLLQALRIVTPDTVEADKSSETSEAGIKVYAHGIEIPLGSPVWWIARQFAYADTFLHLAVAVSSKPKTSSVNASSPRAPPPYSPYSDTSPTHASSRAPAASSPADNADRAVLGWLDLIGRLPKDTKDLKRMYHIDETISNQDNFVADLRTLYLKFYEPLVNTRSEIIPASRRWEFVFEVFGPLPEVLTSAEKLLRLLQERQDQFVRDADAISDNVEALLAAATNLSIGDVFCRCLDGIQLLEFYGPNIEQAHARYNAEIRSNPLFKSFVDTQMKSIGSQAKTPYDYVAAISKRFTDYSLNLKTIREKSSSPDNNLDFAITSIESMLRSMDEATKLTQNERVLNHFFKSTKQDENLRTLNLKGKSRTLVYRTPLTFVKANRRNRQVEMVLFDNFIAMFVKTSDDVEDDPQFDANSPENHSVYRIYRKPMHLDNVSVFVTGDGRSTPEFHRIATVGGASSSPPAIPSGLLRAQTTYGGDQFSFTIFDHSDDSFWQLSDTREITREQWKKAIEKQISERTLTSPMKTELLIDPTRLMSHGLESRFVASAVVGSRLLFATKHSIFVANDGSAFSPATNIMLVCILKVEEVISQVDVVESCNKLLVLAGGSLYSYALSSVLERSSSASSRVLESSSIAFFRVGFCDGKLMICAVGDTKLQWQVKLLDPASTHAKFFGTPKMASFKDLFIPTAVTGIDFLKKRVVIGTSSGFETIHLEKTGPKRIAPLLNISDTNLNFILNREDLVPLSIFRVNESSILLCYEDIGFHISLSGTLLESAPRFIWRGAKPTRFAFISPNVLAFGRNSVDVYSHITGDLVQSIVGHNLTVMGILRKENAESQVASASAVYSLVCMTSADDEPAAVVAAGPPSQQQPPSSSPSQQQQQQHQLSMLQMQQMMQLDQMMGMNMLPMSMPLMQQMVQIGLPLSMSMPVIPPMMMPAIPSQQQFNQPDLLQVPEQQQQQAQQQQLQKPLADRPDGVREGQPSPGAATQPPELPAQPSGNKQRASTTPSGSSAPGTSSTARAAGQRAKVGATATATTATTATKRAKPGEDDSDESDVDDDDAYEKPGTYNRTRAPSAVRAPKIPIPRVKAIMKEDEDVLMVGLDAATAMGFAAEMFLEYFGQKCNEFTTKDSRKTVMYKDLVKAVREVSNLNFLEDIIPPMLPVKKALEVREQLSKAQSADAGSMDADGSHNGDDSRLLSHADVAEDDWMDGGDHDEADDGEDDS
ncbi:RHO1 GDP-GTP exchange protein 2 [Entophlyctis luteolus]|nr:RHO1 GDP-GTP exchange protein 2 [Entophlyctis luteolus]